MPKQSAGILLYRYTKGDLQVLIAHPGGPFWKNKDAGAWSIPKGEYLPGQDPLETAIREFEEEIGTAVSGHFVELPSVRSSSKILRAYALESDLDVSEITSNDFSMEWPPKSGKMQEFPEIDRAEWVDVETARTKLNSYQAPLLDHLLSTLN